MSAQPNALAVLDDLIADMGDTPGTTGHQVAQVRAIFADLIQATRRFCSGMPLQYAENAKVVGNCNAREIENMREALAQCGGA